MSRAPTHRELEVLRYLAVGMRLGPPPLGHDSCPVICKGVAVTTIQKRTVNALFTAGWVAAADAGYTITRAGRDVADCKTFVRAFAECVDA